MMIASALLTTRLLHLTRLMFVLSCGGVQLLYAQQINEPKGQGDDFQLAFHVAVAPEWTALFDRDSGWIGGDGLFSIPLNGVDTVAAGTHTPTLLVFSDSFWGSKAQGKLAPGGKMTNNVVALVPKSTVEKARIQFYSGQAPDGQQTAVFIPHTPSAKSGNYYWLGDGFVNPDKANTTYIFAYRMENTGAKVFGFRECGNALIAIEAGDRLPFTRHRQLETPLFVGTSESRKAYSFGAGVLANTAWASAPNPDGYVYVYGVRGTDKELLVARVRPGEIEDFKQWQYWNGSAWDSNIRHAAKVTANVSNELSVTPLPDGRYALIFQQNGIEPLIGLRIGKSPIGPFGSIIPVYHCPEPTRKKSLFAYNAKAHPHLSKPGELLISYHVNSFDFLKDFNEAPGTFSPRFIKLILD